MTEHPQLPIPRIGFGYTVDVVAESYWQIGELATAEKLALSPSQVERAVKMWEEWKVTNRMHTETPVEVTAMPLMITCDKCCFWTLVTEGRYANIGFGDCVCESWWTGYGLAHSSLSPADVVVEDDEGWGFYAGPKFGCIHGRPREMEMARDPH